MVWIPDAIVTDYFTRDSAPDASNRAKHHCNACKLVFPIGNNASMREHILICPSLSAAAIASITSRIAAEIITPKRVTRDPRWTKAEEQTLLRLDANVPSGKKEGKYGIMAEAIGRSAQACRQKLIHLKENQAIKSGEQETTKRVLWKRKAKGSKVKVEEDNDEEEDFIDVEFADVLPVRTARSRKTALKSKIEEVEVSSKSKSIRSKHDSDATISDPNSPTKTAVTTRRTSLTTVQHAATISFATDQFLRLLRWQIHSALTDFGIVRGFYTSDQSIKSGWGVFVASDIPVKDKDTIVARLIGLWLDGLDTDSFEREVDAKIESVVFEMSEWVFEKGDGNPMAKAIERMSTDEDEDSGYDGDDSYDDGAQDAMEL